MGRVAVVILRDMLGVLGRLPLPVLHRPDGSVSRWQEVQFVWWQLFEFDLRVEDGGELLELLAAPRVSWFWLFLAVLVACGTPGQSERVGVDTIAAASPPAGQSTGDTPDTSPIATATSFAREVAHENDMVIESVLLGGLDVVVRYPELHPPSGQVVSVQGFIDGQYVLMEAGNSQFALDVASNIGGMSPIRAGEVDLLRSVRVEDATLIWRDDEMGIVVATDADGVRSVAGFLSDLMSSNDPAAVFESGFELDGQPQVSVSLEGMGTLSITGTRQPPCDLDDPNSARREGATWDVARYSWNHSGAVMSMTPHWPIISEDAFEQRLGAVQVCLR